MQWPCQYALAAASAALCPAGAADLVCVEGANRSRRATVCSCGDYHSFALMDNGDVFGW